MKAHFDSRLFVLPLSHPWFSISFYGFLFFSYRFSLSIFFMKAFIYLHSFGQMASS